MSSPSPAVQAPAGRVAAQAAVAAAALALIFACFSPALRAEFVSDDVNAIVENEWVRGQFDPAGIATNFSWWGQGRADSPGYRPAATLSFAVNRQAAGLDPFGFRLVNFAMHALCTLLLFALARSLGLGVLAAGAAALLFAVLPIHSEAVIWIVGRAELGAAAGFLVAAWMTVIHRRRGSFAALAVAAAAVAIGMAFKENAVTVLAWPAILFVVQREKTGPGQGAGTSRENGNGDTVTETATASRSDAKPPRTSRAARREAARAKGAAPAPTVAAAATATPSSTVPRDAAALAAMLAGLAAYALLRHHADGPPITPEPGSLLDNPLSVVDATTRLLGALAVFGRYIGLTFWPASLSIDYSYDALGIGPGFRANADTLVAVAFLAAAAWAALRGPGRRSVVAAGLLMTAASYSIVSNTVFVLGTILGERLFYLPSAGICLAIAAMLEPALRSAGRRGAAVAFLAVAVVAAIAVDRSRAAEWKTPASLFEAAVAAVPRSARAQMELGSAYGSAGRLDEALPHFAASLEILPDYASAAYNQGNALAKARRFDEAAVAFRRALQANPKLLRAWHNLVVTEQSRGDRAAWIDALKGEGLAFAGSPSVANDVGDILIRAGAYTEAVAVYDAVIARGVGTVPSYFNRGVARHHLGGCAAGLEDYRRAASMPGAPREVLDTAAGCLKELGRYDEAAALAKAAQVANRDTRR